MKKKFAFMTGLIAFAYASQAIACSLAPDYLPGEVGVIDVQLGNLVKHSNKIIIGKLSDNGHQKAPTLKVVKSLKPKQKWFYERSVEISFFETEKFHSIDKRDETAFKSIAGIQDYLNIFRRETPDFKASDDNKGYGGVIAGIGHGSDCERIVFSFAKQEYLTFLDDNNMVLGLLPIDLTKIDNLNNLVDTLDQEKSKN